MVHGEHIAVDLGLSPSVRVVRARARVRRRACRSRNVNHQCRALRVVRDGRVPAVHGDGRRPRAVLWGAIPDVSLHAGPVFAMRNLVARARVDAGGVLARAADGGPRALPVQRHGHRPARLRVSRRARPTTRARGGAVLGAGPHQTHLRVRGSSDGGAPPRASRRRRVALGRVHQPGGSLVARRRVRNVRGRRHRGIVLPDMACGDDGGHAHAVVPVRQRFVPRVLGAKLLGAVQLRRQVRAGARKASRSGYVFPGARGGT